MRMTRLIGGLLAMVLAMSANAASFNNADLKKQLADAERAFAATMKNRDFEAFKSFISEDAVFFGDKPAYGREAIAAVWKKYYDKPAAPFSWEPEEVEVVGSGNLAFSTGPVRNAAGKVTAHFSSIWRLEPDGKWRNIIDRGWPECDCAKAQ